VQLFLLSSMTETDIQGVLSNQPWISPYVGSVSSAAFNSLKVPLPQSLLLLNAMCLLKNVLSYEQDFPSFTMLRSGLTAKGLEIVWPCSLSIPRRIS
jgi:hypothetical protein